MITQRWTGNDMKEVVLAWPKALPRNLEELMTATNWGGTIDGSLTEF